MIFGKVIFHEIGRFERLLSVKIRIDSKKSGHKNNFITHSECVILTNNRRFLMNR